MTNELANYRTETVSEKIPVFVPFFWFKKVASTQDKNPESPPLPQQQAIESNIVDFRNRQPSTQIKLSRQ